MALRARIEAYLREVLVDPSGRLEVGEDGPHWRGSSANLSYSHSDGGALLVYSRTARLGVDIERENRAFAQSPEALARRFFHSSEVGAARDRATFLRLWCKKEALGKWSRGGLKESLRVIVEPAPEGVRLESVPVTPEGWVAYVALNRV